MKYRKLISETVEEHYEMTRIVCDLCKCDIRKKNKGGSTEITLDAKIGNHWGTDGDAREGYYLDVCEECFKDKVMPALENLEGVKWHEYNCDDQSLRLSISDYWGEDSTV